MQNHNHDNIERINRVNFRASLEAMARPGQLQQVQPLFDSILRAMAGMLLYSEVSYWYEGREDFQMIQAICGAKSSGITEADYLFYDQPERNILVQAKVGTAEQPELGATLLFRCRDLDGTGVILSGPGIKTTLRTSLPVDTDFISLLQEKNEVFPMGVDLFFLSDAGQLLGLPRTTQIEVTP